MNYFKVFFQALFGGQKTDAQNCAKIPKILKQGVVENISQQQFPIYRIAFTNPQ